MQKRRQLCASADGSPHPHPGSNEIRVYSAAKTAADCFKYRNKVGIDVAVEALRDFSRKYRGGATELARFARTGDDYQTLRTGKLPDISPRDC